MNHQYLSYLMIEAEWVTDVINYVKRLSRIMCITAQDISTFTGIPKHIVYKSRRGEILH